MKIELTSAQAADLFARVATGNFSNALVNTTGVFLCVLDVGGTRIRRFTNVASSVNAVITILGEYPVAALTAALPQVTILAVDDLVD